MLSIIDQRTTVKIPDLAPGDVVETTNGQRYLVVQAGAQLGAVRLDDFTVIASADPNLQVALLQAELRITGYAP